MRVQKYLKKKLYKRKDDSSNSNSVRDVPTNDKNDDASQTVAVASGSDVPEYPDSLKEAWAVTHQEPPRVHGAEKFLNSVADIQDSVTPPPGQQGVVDTLAVPAKALMDVPQISETIHKGVNAFMKAAPVLMKALDEVAKIHPFISVAVLAFKAVYTLEAKRRENDNRVLMLYVEMKDMMEVLVQLKDVSDPKHIAPDNQTIEGRMQKLCEAVAGDIKKCANACDTYRKKKLLVKIFAGFAWESTLLEFVGVFTKRRGEFKLAMAIHTTVGVDVANLKLDTLDERTAELDRKMEAMSQLFQEFVSVEQKKLAAMVDKIGGEAAQDNEQSMRELANAEAALVAPSDSDSRHAGGYPFDLAKLQDEIKETPDKAIEKNAEFFSRKLHIQMRQITEDIERAVRREGDRVIEAVTAGPHDRIVDSDIYNIWKDAGWRVNVKEQDFIMALKDYYTGGPDGWAIDYINISRTQCIMEAFDDDASGSVAIHEVNIFTRSRPRDWSLPHTIAYWAIGWQMTCTTYCKKIEEIFDAMIRLAYQVRQENRKEVNKYIAIVWMNVMVFVQSIEREEGTEYLRSKFEPYVAAEEARLQQNFEDIKYDIDSYDTTRLIAGGGRVETTLFPMLYLALKRDLERISLARKHVLSDYELVDASETILYITDAAWYRIYDLRSIFEKQSLKANSQFESFAKGLYNIGNTHGAIFHGDKLRALPDPIPCRDEMIPDPDSIPLSVLNHPLGLAQEIDFGAYDPLESTLPPVEGADPVLGVYYGFIYTNGMPTDPMIKLILNEGEEENTFVATGTHYRWGEHKNYEISGKRDPPLEDGKIRVELMLAYTTTWANVKLTGVFDPEENSLRGTTFVPIDGSKGEFVFKRNPDLARFYPAPLVINGHTRWEFTRALFLDLTRRDAWSRTRILKKIRDKKRYVELSLRFYYGRDLNEEELAEFYALLLVLDEADARFCASLIRIKLSETPIFWVSCDNCGSTPGGSRIVCMDCNSERWTLDLCSEPDCINSVVKFEASGKKQVHLPTHEMFKVHRIIFDRDTRRIENTAKDALASARATLLELEEGQPKPECTHCKTAISLPCWYCVDCAGQRFICDSCEHKQLAFDDMHTRMHTIVRVFERVEEWVLSVEELLQRLEDKVRMTENEAA